jgi:quinolinate synthase
VTYVNTYADVKAESDICCTSSNAKAVVESLHTDKVIFLPDEYLGGNVARELGWNIIYPDVKSTTENTESTEKEKNLRELREASRRDSGLRGKTLIGWRGRCEVHEKFTVNDIQTVRAQFPDVAVLSHPECSPDVTAASDFSGSTNAMIKYVKESNAPQYLVLTECAMGDNIAAANPEKDMLRLCMVRCPHMNTITMEDTLEALKFNRYVIDVPEDIRVRAERSVKRMIGIG